MNGHIRWQFLKKAILICAMLLLFGFLIGYFNYKGNEKIYTGDNEAEVLSQDTITKLNIGIIPDTGDLDDYEIFDKEDIGTVVDFLNRIIRTTKIENHQDDSYGGGGYNLEFYDKDNQSVNIVLMGMFLAVDGKKWKLPDEKVSEFARIMAEIIYKRYHNDATYICLKGEVTELYNEDAHIKDSNGFKVLSRRRMCILDTDDKEIDISYCYIFDFKKNEVFSGPEKGNQVEIYLKTGERGAKAIFRTT